MTLDASPECRLALFNPKLGDNTMTNNNNIFSDFFSSWSNKNPFAETINLDVYIEAWRLNAQALTDISTSVLDNIHDLSTGQIKIVQKNAEELTKFFKEMADATTKPEDKIARHADFVKESVESTLNDSKELAEKAVKHSTATGEIINKKATEVFSGLAKNGKPGAKKEKAKQAA